MTWGLWGIGVPDEPWYRTARTEDALTLYHHTTPQSAQRILDNGFQMRRNHVFFSTKPHDPELIQHGEIGDTVLTVQVPRRFLNLDDIQPKDRSVRWVTAPVDVVNQLPVNLHRTAFHTAMPAIDAYDNDPQYDDDYNPIPGTEQFPEEHRYDEQEIQPGPYYHATDQVFKPGDVVQSHSALHGHQGDRGNHADWVWMARHPDTALGHAGPHLYEVEPMDEGPWEWNQDIFSNPGDDGRYVSPRARVVRMVPHNYPFWANHKHASRTAMPDAQFPNPRRINQPSASPTRPTTNWEGAEPEQPTLSLDGVPTHMTFPMGGTWTSPEGEVSHTPNSVYSVPIDRKPIKIYRGLPLDMEKVLNPDINHLRRRVFGDEIEDSVHEVLNNSWAQKTKDTHFNHLPGMNSHRDFSQPHPDWEHDPDFGNDAIRALGHFEGRGTGTHWSRNPDIAHQWSQIDDSGSRHSVPFILSADWYGQGEDEKREGTVDDYNEDEITLLPSAPIHIRQIHMQHPQTKKWHPLLPDGHPGFRHTASRTAMPWYHVSPHDLPVGTRLVPGGGDSPLGFDNDYDDPSSGYSAGSRSHVWVAPDTSWASEYVSYGPDDHDFQNPINPFIYEVEPEREPRPVGAENDLNPGGQGWITPGAVIKRVHQKGGRPHTAASRTAMPYYHQTDAELNPGDELLPAAERGHKSRWEDEYGPYPDYDPHSVYMLHADSDKDIPMNYHNWYGKNIYEVEPFGEIKRDKEFYQNLKDYAEELNRPEDHPEGRWDESDVPAYSSYTAPRARVIRKLNTASRTAMPAIDAYDANSISPRKPFPQVPQGAWYHGSDHDIPEETILTPRGGKSRFTDIYDAGWENRPDWVWMTNQPDAALQYGQNLYEVEPLDEGPWPWNGHVVGSDYVSPRARVIRKIEPKESRIMTAAVTVYTRPSCPQCMATKKHLDKLGIDHDTVDVTQDPDAHAYVTGLGYQAAPVVVVNAGEDHWSGYRPDRLKGLAE